MSQPIGWSLLWAASGSIVTLLVTTVYYRKQIAQLEHTWRERRQEERTGRIRAEVKLRTMAKPTSLTSGLTLQCIGTVVSPYTKRMGTPRQPQLVPASRGYIAFAIEAERLDGIDAYSHVWILFGFHANTNVDNRRTKIRPPRGGGLKIGQLATRSPHRPNPIGLSLVQLERWEPLTRRLYISGLDLVNSTPVYDVKPCVPWDVPTEALKVPDWVDQDDAIAEVVFTEQAEQHLADMVGQGRLAPLYTHANDGLSGAKLTLQQVLAQDPRSSHKGIDARGSRSATMTYSLIFGQCQVDFTVTGEGVTVTDVTAVDFDPSSYVDGVPLISKNKE